MDYVIILDNDQADAVRGPSSSVPNAILEPVRIDDTSSYLGEEVMSDPAHAEHYAIFVECDKIPFVDISAWFPNAAQAGEEPERKAPPPG
jgi:hypothetical protein